MLDNGDLRMLGARDGVATAAIAVKREIERVEYRRISPRATRQLAERERTLAPLRRLLIELTGQCASIKVAYEATRQPKPE